MQCDQCEGIAVWDGCSMSTLMGAMYNLKTGHKHDDNCLTRIYVCNQNSEHQIKVSIRRRCETPGCEWRGKETCFCHPGTKLDEWPD